MDSRYAALISLMLSFAALAMPSCAFTLTDANISMPSNSQFLYINTSGFNQLLVNDTMGIRFTTVTADTYINNTDTSASCLVQFLSLSSPYDNIQWQNGSNITSNATNYNVTIPPATFIHVYQATTTEAPAPPTTGPGESVKGETLPLPINATIEPPDAAENLTNLTTILPINLSSLQELIPKTIGMRDMATFGIIIIIAFTIMLAATNRRTNRRLSKLKKQIKKQQEAKRN